MMTLLPPFSRFGRVLLVALALLLGSLQLAPSAQAHAELRQSSPAAGETVGGDIHSIALQFFDLDVLMPQEAAVFDAAGTELPSQINREDQRIVIALRDPIETPGDYTVTYAVHGIDGDFTEESFVFTWAEGAPEPSGITVQLFEDQGFDWINFALILVGAALAAFIVQRFMFAWREHRAAQG